SGAPRARCPAHALRWRLDVPVTGLGPAGRAERKGQPQMYEFPFEVPADLTAVTDEALAELSTRVREHAQALLNEDNADPDALVATRDLFNSVTAETNRRATAN